MTSSWIARASPYALRSLLPMLEVAPPDEHCEAMCRKIRCDLKTNSGLGTGDQAVGIHRPSVVPNRHLSGTRTAYGLPHLSGSALLLQ